MIDTPTPWGWLSLEGSVVFFYVGIFCGIVFEELFLFTVLFTIIIIVMFYVLAWYTNFNGFVNIDCKDHVWFRTIFLNFDRSLLFVFVLNIELSKLKLVYFNIIILFIFSLGDSLSVDRNGTALLLIRGISRLYAVHANIISFFHTKAFRRVIFLNFVKLLFWFF